MKKLHQEKEGKLRVISCGLLSSQQMSLLANDKRILCYQRRQDNQWEPIYTDNQSIFIESLGIAAAINRL
jgi:hypothetical protein